MENYEMSEDEQKKFSPFIINRWLSMDKDFIEIVNFFQKYSIGTLEPREVYKWYCDILPKGKRFALAGSISEDNIVNIAKLGVSFCDLSSNLELDEQKGFKDHQKIKRFINKVNEIKN